MPAAAATFGLDPGSLGLPLAQVVLAGAFLFTFGFGIGGWDLTERRGAQVERRDGRSVMPKFHTAFSDGAFIGALPGAATASG